MSTPPLPPTPLKTNAGTRKITVASLIGASVTIVVYVLKLYEITMPMEVVAAATTVITGLSTYMTAETYT
jgi:hypothetical protein